MTADRLKKLQAEGWLPQFTASGSRLAEAVENYRDLGFEVMTIPYRDVAAGSCTACFEEADVTMLILTRKPAGEGDASGSIDKP